MSFSTSAWHRIASPCTPASVRPAAWITARSSVTAKIASSMACCTLGPCACRCQPMKGRPSNSTVKAKRVMRSGGDPTARGHVEPAQQFPRRHRALARPLDQRGPDRAMPAADQQAVVEQFARRSAMLLHLRREHPEPLAAIFEERAGKGIEGAHLPLDLMRVPRKVDPRFRLVDLRGVGDALF